MKIESGVHGRVFTEVAFLEHTTKERRKILAAAAARRPKVSKEVYAAARVEAWRKRLLAHYEAEDATESRRLAEIRSMEEEADGI